MMYTVPSGPEIEQGDVFEGCPLPVLPDDAAGTGLTPLVIPTARVVVLTQTCDLAQGKASRVVVAVCYPAELLVARQVLKPATIRDQIRPGKMYGWYFLPAATGSVPLSETVIDFRDLHTLPVSVLARLVTDGKRVCRISSPYREHLAQHFAVTYMRIALPEPYETRP